MHSSLPAVFAQQPLVTAAVVVAGVAGVFDWKTGEIPNWLNFGALALGLFGHAALGLRAAGAAGLAPGFGGALLGLFACAVVPLFLFRVGGMAGGDVKLLGAVGALCLWRVGFAAEFYSFFAAALIAPARLAYEGRLMATLKNSLVILVNPVLPAAKRRRVAPEMLTSMRFAPAVFVGVVAAAVLEGRWS